MSFSNKTLQKQVLKCVVQGLPFSSLKDCYSFGQIADAVLEADKNGLIIYRENKYLLTEKGQETLNSKIEYIEFKTSERNVRYDTIDIDELYIPKYNKEQKRKTEN